MGNKGDLGVVRVVGRAGQKRPASSDRRATRGERKNADQRRGRLTIDQEAKLPGFHEFVRQRSTIRALLDVRAYVSATAASAARQAALANLDRLVGAEIRAMGKDKASWRAEYIDFLARHLSTTVALAAGPVVDGEFFAAGCTPTQRDRDLAVAAAKQAVKRLRSKRRR